MAPGWTSDVHGKPAAVNPFQALTAIGATMSKTMEVHNAVAGLNLCKNVGPDAMSKVSAADAAAAYVALPLATWLRLAASPRPWRSTAPSLASTSARMLAPTRCPR